MRPNAGAIFSGLLPFEERRRQGPQRRCDPGRSAQAARQHPGRLHHHHPAAAGAGHRHRRRVQDDGAGSPGSGIGRAGGSGRRPDRRRQPDARAWSACSRCSAPRTPTVYADIDREKAEKLGVSPDKVFEALQVYLGSAYINDFNYLGRTYQVMAQADGGFRSDVDDIGRLKTRNASGAMVPIGSVAQFHDMTGPYRVPRYDLYPAAEVQGNALPGVSSGYALATMERLAAEHLPPGIRLRVDGPGVPAAARPAPRTLLIFAASVLFVFLVLAAQYESWSLPLSVVLIVPMCLLAAVTGLMVRGMNVDILAQVGFVVLVGLAAKNAILIVEFAKQAEDAGESVAAAAAQAARTRLRPILMTSFAFILGVVPLVTATGAGAEMRQSLGTAVFAGMLGVTLFGLVFTPVFYATVRRLVRRRLRGAALIAHDTRGAAAE